MELLVIAVLGGVFLAVVLLRLIQVVTFRAVDNLIDWLVYTFGSDEAVKRRANERSTRESTEKK